MATNAQSDVKYLQFPISISPNADGMSPAEAEEVLRGYMAKGFSLVSTTVTGVSASGFNVVHVLVK